MLGDWGGNRYTKFSINAGFNTQFNLRYKVRPEFGIILSLMLIVSPQIGLKLDSKPAFRPRLIWASILIGILCSRSAWFYNWSIIARCSPKDKCNHVQLYCTLWLLADCHMHPHLWRCKNGRCVFPWEVCNFMDDCGDGSDESICVDPPIGEYANITQISGLVLITC